MRHTLTHELRNLQQLNAYMEREANNLSKTLKHKIMLVNPSILLVTL